MLRDSNRQVPKPRGGRRLGAGRKRAISHALRAAAAMGLSPREVAMMEMEAALSLYNAAMRGNATAQRQFLARSPEPLVTSRHASR